MCDKTSFISFDNLKRKYDIKGTFLDYLQIINIIPDTWKHTIRHFKNIPVFDMHITLCQQELVKPGKGSRSFYDKFMACNDLPHVCCKWQTIFKDIDFEWSEVYTTYRIRLKDIKLLDFQFRFLHGIIYTKNELFKMKLVDNVMCYFCKASKESICHVYWECRVVHPFWTSLEIWINKNIYNKITITKYLVFFGTLNKNLLINHVILSAKKYIHLCSIKQIMPTLTSYQKNLQDIFHVEKYIAKRNNAIDDFVNKWQPIFPT